jgi:hydroxyacylglutathione hydrolase
MLPLEDFYNDVIGKAQRGLKLDDETLATKAGVSLADVAAAKAGESQAHLHALSVALGLHGDSLAAMAANQWYPNPVDLTELAQFNTPYHDMTVNAYVVHDPVSREAAAFDTGASAAPMLHYLKSKNLTLRYLFITHTHGDHVADISSVLSAHPSAVLLSNADEPALGGTNFSLVGHPHWKVGSLKVSPRLTTGHSKGGITYYIEGLSKPVAVVGDALFASSMGGGMVSYPEALATNRAQIFTLPDETVICPGHGPLTTLAEEKAHNPFYPEFKTA